MQKGIVVVLMMAFTACSLLGSGGGPEIPGRIVFAANDSTGNSQIFTMRADGTELRQLTFLEGDEAYMPAWSPDGTQIVFSTSLQSSSNGFSLYIMDADGGNMRPMNEREGSHIPTPGNNARWGPDGSRIVFDLCTNCQVGTNHELFLYEFATDSVIQLTDTDFPVSNSHPAWSPDGQRIVFITNRDYVDADTMQFRKDLYVINADGTGLQRLTETGNATRPKWGPDGSKIAYEWNIRGNEVFIYEVSTGRIRNIETGLTFTGNPLWSPAGNRLLVFGRETEQSRPEARLLNVQDESTEILIKIILQDQAIGRNYDWFISNDN